MFSVIFKLFNFLNNVHYLSKVLGPPQKFLFLILKVLFLMKQVKYHNGFRKCPLGVIVKAMDSRIIVSEFELQLRYYIHFQTNTIGKGMNPLIHPAMG